MLNNDKDNLGKLDAKSDEGIFLGYSLQSKSFRIYNKRTMIIEEFIHDYWRIHSMQFFQENMY